MEYKVRRVRTAAGEARFKQPRDTIITADYVPNIPLGTPLGPGQRDVGRLVRYVGPDAPGHNAVEITGRLTKFRSRRGRTNAEITDHDGITHVINVPSDIWKRMSHALVDIEDAEILDWEVATIGGKEYYFGPKNRRWHVLQGKDKTKPLGKFTTREEAVRFLENMAPGKKPKRISRTQRAKQARDTDFPHLIEQAILDDADRRNVHGQRKATAREIATLSKPYHDEMKRRGLKFWEDVKRGEWFMPLGDSALKHGVYRKKNKDELISELGVVYPIAHIGPVVRPVSTQKVLELTLQSILSALTPQEHKQMPFGTEVKSVVRHVATPEGVRRYGLPIGAVIVARNNRDVGKQLAFIWRDRGGKPDADGYVSYSGSDDSPVKGTSTAAKYRVKKTGSKWVAIDEAGKTVVTGTDEGNLLENLNAYSKKRTITIHARSKRGAGWVEKQGNREAPPGMHRATGDELVDLGLPYNRRIVDIFLYDDQNSPQAKKSYGYGFDRKGNGSSFTKSAHVEKQKASVFATVEIMAPAMPDFEKAIEAHWERDDTYKALWLMRRFAMRVGTSAADARQTDPDSQAFGATKIEARMVTINDDGSVSLVIPSKKRAITPIHADDPLTVAIITAAMKGKSGTDKLFDTNHTKTERVIKQMFGPNVTNHNLRHYRACEEATFIINEWIKEYPMPESYKEMVDEWAAPLGEIIEQEVLHDKKGQGWKSYIDPNILLAVCGNHPEWVDQFRDKYQQKGVA